KDKRGKIKRRNEIQRTTAKKKSTSELRSFSELKDKRVGHKKKPSIKLRANFVSSILRFLSFTFSERLN
ncbi:MAG: hypothetical protein ABFR62_11620, partial [Bacteroidota bacterium]